ncbi:PadR family transcriptional regulator [Lacticaseibacillus parakribbianus]|uniref:PadR family transcriptional regulator n=1 Tax=Lacticaseibacillus parakribbianus TaxID=2970927 RepID=UPI0021CB1CCB|nr:PadR family transcriptional regulator [Lacticaseibacillus parakribbianus]
MVKISSQLLKGTLENAILMIIAQGETYGYALLEQLTDAGFGKIPEGTVYPLLLKLQRNGLIHAVRHASTTGPDRKYYQLTPHGAAQLRAFLPQWRQLKTAMGKLVATHDKEGHDDTISGQ